MRADHTGNAVAVGDADRVVFQRDRDLDHLSGMRGAAQEGEVGRGDEFGVAHAKNPCIYQRGSSLSRYRPLRKTNGRASCRARGGAYVWSQVVAGPLNKKKT